MILLVVNWMFNKTTQGITLWPFIIVKNGTLKQDKVLINHERIHLRQQIEFLIVPFYLWYVIEFLIRLIQYKSRKKAYLNISFEREAYTNDNNLNYLKNRSFWRFLKFI